MRNRIVLEPHVPAARRLIRAESVGVMVVAPPLFGLKVDLSERGVPSKP